jgi:arylsulfatase A-like enzyme
MSSRGKDAGRARIALAVGLGAVLAVSAGLAYQRLLGSPLPLRKVVLVTIDALRADRLGCYGYERRATTPVLDALAEESVLFERAMAQAPWTGPSMASMMTGRYPAETGMYRNRDRIAAELPVLPETFQRSGFRTASFMTNSLLLSKNNGFLRGFDETSAPERLKIAYGDLEPQIFAWLEKHAGENFFVWIHNMDPHPPATVGNHYRNGHDFPGYDGEVKWVDEAMGRLVEKLRSLGIWDEVLFIFTADHGEAFGEHRLSGHQNVIYDEVLHIPLIVHYPRMRWTGRVAEPVELLDLYATIGDLAGLSLPERGRSESLVSLLEGRAEQRRKSYLFHSRYYFENNTHHLAVRDRQWKLIAKVNALLDGDGKPVFPPRWQLDGDGSQFEIYRFDEDPRETKNRIDDPEAAGAVAKLRGALRAWQQLIAPNGPPGRELKDLDPATLEILRNLGYVD